MTPDYSKYSIADLEDVLRTIDGKAYPENEAAARAELERRRHSGEYQEQIAEVERLEAEKVARRIRFARSAVPHIAWFLMGTAPVFVVFPSILAPAGKEAVVYVMLALSAIYGACSFVAGFGLQKKKKWGYAAAVFVLAVQSLSLASEAFFLKIASVVSVHFVVSANLHLGLEANLSAVGFRFVANPEVTPAIGVNLFALFLIWLLVTARDSEAATDVV